MPLQAWDSLIFHISWLLKFIPPPGEPMVYSGFTPAPIDPGCGFIQYDAATPTGVWDTEDDCTTEKAGLCETVSTAGEYYTSMLWIRENLHILVYSIWT